VCSSDLTIVARTLLFVLLAWELYRQMTQPAEPEAVSPQA
jgi:hypothetical protein